MTEQATPSADRGLSSADEERLESWKEIASYLKRDVRTVQRWEKREGLPVHRHQHEKLGSVYAYKGQLDAWRTNGHSDSAPEFQAAATQPRRRIVLWTLLGVAGALLGIGIHWFPKTFFASKVVLAVQPFRNLGEKSDDFISAGLTEEMIARLGQLHPGRLSLIALTQNGTPRRSDFRFFKIHADYILEGTVRRKRLSLKAKLQPARPFSSTTTSPKRMIRSLWPTLSTNGTSLLPTVSSAEPSTSGRCHDGRDEWSVGRFRLTPARVGTPSE